MRHAIDRVVQYTESGRDAFLADTMVQDAGVGNLEIVGEAAKRVSPSLQEQAQSVPWRETAGMRDKLVHDYFGVDLALVWDVVEGELPKVRVSISALLDDASLRGGDAAH